MFDRQHLYRHHRIYPCERCKHMYNDDDEVTDHLKNGACETNESELPDGVTGSMERQLRNRRKAFPGQTEEQIWRQIYKVLFPLVLDEDIPTPCECALTLLIMKQSMPARIMYLEVITS